MVGEFVLCRLVPCPVLEVVWGVLYEQRDDVRSLGGQRGVKGRRDAHLNHRPVTMYSRASGRAEMLMNSRFRPFARFSLDVRRVYLLDCLASEMDRPL